MNLNFSISMLNQATPIQLAKEKLEEGVNKL